VHEALKRARRSRREASTELGPELPMPEPELVAMRGAYGAEFTRALSESFQALTAQERTLLRQYFLDGLTIDVLAGLYRIHRATAARRVTAARTRLVDSVRAALARDLGLSDTGVDQVITLSNLNESLGQLLRSTR
jgi:RNA polymerase sigma-70 factor (ECF subfamily)